MKKGGGGTLVKKREQEDGGSEEGDKGHGVTHLGRQGHSPTSRSGTVMAADFRGDEVDGVSMVFG